MVPDPRAFPAMDLHPLDESWQIVLVVTSENVGQLSHTLEDVLYKSYRRPDLILASESPLVRSVVSDLSLPVAFKLPQTIKSGSYWSTVVSSHDFKTNRTIFLQAGTRVPEAWDARLVAAGQRAMSAVAVSPQCVRHPILSVFGNRNIEPELVVDEVDQWLNDYASGSEYPMPLVLESCALLQGDCWRTCISSSSSDTQLFSDLRSSGVCFVATDQLYIDDSNTKYTCEINQLPLAYRVACMQRSPLAGVHHALSELTRRRESPPFLRRCLPVQLHIGHSWGGGLSRWMEDYIAADMAHNHLVLRSIGDLSGFGQTIALYRSTDMDVPIETWSLSEPILSVSIMSYEYGGIIETLVNRYSVESIVVSSLIGHALDLLRTGLPTTVVLHDFFPFCPALYATFGSPCLSCNDYELHRCANENPKNTYFKFETNDHWMAIRKEFVRLITCGPITVVAPTQSVIDRYRKLVSGMSAKPIHVIAHGLDGEMCENLKPISTATNTSSAVQSRLQVVILGRLTEEKGGKLLGQILSQLSVFADLYLLGAGESGADFFVFRGVTVRESYRKEELGNLLHEIKPDIGMLLSTVPETFSYTLSELWAGGIPVLATRLGAFADRISDMQNGWLVEPEPSVILHRLQALHTNRTLLESAKRTVVAQPVRTAYDMVRDYAATIPRLNYVPMMRYHLPRRSYRNPYLQPLSKHGSGALYIDHQRPYKHVLAEFLSYTSRKVEQSPKVPVWVRGLVCWCVRRAERFLVG